MRTLIIVDGLVVDAIMATVEEAQAAYPDAVCVDAEQGGAIGWRYVDGQLLPPIPTQEAIEASKAAALRFWDGVVQGKLDTVAKGFGYGDPNRPDVSPILHAISYADEPAVVKFQAEGRLLRAWRSRYWMAAAYVLNNVTAGTRDVPTVEDLLVELDQAAPPPTADDVTAEVARLTPPPDPTPAPTEAPAA